MKVNIQHTVMVSDHYRQAIAAEIDRGTEPARLATREEVKDYIWSKGSGWDFWFKPDPEETEETEETEEVGLSASAPYRSDPADELLEDADVLAAEPDPGDDDDPYGGLL